MRYLKIFTAAALFALLAGCVVEPYDSGYYYPGYYYGSSVAVDVYPSYYGYYGYHGYYHGGYGHYGYRRW